MVYVIGIFGFIAGFIGGLGIINYLLQDVPKEELVNDPAIKWKYGILCWAVAALGAYVSVSVYTKVLVE